jgi:phosphoglycolate phosphatase
LHLIFDLDGTLVDSRPGIQGSLREAVRQVFPDINPAGLDFEIGPPVREMFQKALQGVSLTELDQLQTVFRVSYDGSGWKQTYAYPGVGETLNELTQRGNACYLVTNKPALSTSRILTHLGLAHYFKEMLSPDSHQPGFKNKAAALGFLLESQRIANENAMYIGDSAEDLGISEKYGLGFIGIEYGYGVFPKTKKGLQVIRSFAELLIRI